LRPTSGKLLRVLFSHSALVPKEVFDAAERLDLERIVAQRKTDSYRPETVWYEIRVGPTHRAKAAGSCSRFGDCLGCYRVVLFTG
jgi:hypothetical protein